MHSPRTWIAPTSLVCLLAAAIVFVDRARPDLLIAGNVTVDVVNGNNTLGGAVSYAAAVAKQLGKSACVITGPEADLSLFVGQKLTTINTSSTLTFVHSYTWWGHKRVMHVTAAPNVTIGAWNVPLWCLLSRVLLLGPLLPNDIDAKTFTKSMGVVKYLFSQEMGLMAQGYQRDLDTVGKVVPLLTPHTRLLDALAPGVSVFLSDVETDPWSEADMTEVVSNSDRLIVTRGELGANEYTREGVQTIPVQKVTAVDTNGAGDTFATAYMLALASRTSNPGNDAAQAAACTVTKPQACKPWCIAKCDSGIFPRSPQMQNTS